MPPHAPDAVALSHDDERPVKRYTLQDVSKHNTPEDCWLVIWGKVYDVTSWVPKHPGGSLIFVKAGQDSTQLFDSYHPLYVRKLLGKYCVGELQRNAEDLKEHYASIEYSDGDQEAFYLTVKQRVETYFRKHKINPRFHPHMFLKTAVIVGVYFLSYYYAFFGSHNIFVSMLLASIMGFAAAEVGISVMHDGNHGAYSQSCTFGYLMGATLDLVGASSFMWRQQHVVGHHSFTNVDSYDPDIRVKDPDIRRVTSDQPRQWYHQYQHIYLGALYGLLALKSVLADDFSAYFSGSIGSVKVAPMTPLEFKVFWGSKAFYAFYMLLLPLTYGHYNAFAFIGLYILSQLVTGWTLALMFQVAHVVGDAAFLIVETDESKAKVPSGWAEMQVRTTTNFSVKSSFWTHISGGLNHQIEHHLFPSVCHVHYPLIQPIVKSTCEEFNVPYTAYPTFVAALKAHFSHLKQVGLQDGLRLDG
ncbi:unnamed protein product [Calypogeia fissa]